MKISRKQQVQIENYIREKLEEKTSPRQKPSLEPDWQPPDAKPVLPKEDARQVDSKLKRIMRPDKPRE